MNLLERSQSLSGEISLNQKKSVDSDAVQRLQSRRDQIVPISLAVDKLVRSVNLLREISDDVDSGRFSVGNFTLKAEEFDTNFGANPDSATDANEAWRFQFINPLKESVDQWNAMVKRAWDSYLYRTLEMPDEALLGALRNVPEFHGLADSFEIIDKEFDALLEVDLPTQGEIEEATELKKKIAQVWSKIEASGISESTKTFLINASKHDAKIDDLDAETVSWLQKYGVDTSIRIGFKSR